MLRSGVQPESRLEYKNLCFQAKNQFLVTFVKFTMHFNQFLCCFYCNFQNLSPSQFQTDLIIVKQSKVPFKDIFNQSFTSQIKFKSLHRQSFISWSFISWQSSKGPKEGHDWYLFAPFYYLHFILSFTVFWTDFQSLTF